MAINNYRQEVYDFLSKRGYTDSFDVFNADMDDDKRRKQFYDYLSANGLSDSFETFSSNIGTRQAAQSTQRQTKQQTAPAQQPTANLVEQTKSSTSGLLPETDKTDVLTAPHIEQSQTRAEIEQPDIQERIKDIDAKLAEIKSSAAKSIAQEDANKPLWRKMIEGMVAGAQNDPTKETSRVDALLASNAEYRQLTKDRNQALSKLEQLKERQADIDKRREEILKSKADVEKTEGMSAWERFVRIIGSNAPRPQGAIETPKTYEERTNTQKHNDKIYGEREEKLRQLSVEERMLNRERRKIEMASRNENRHGFWENAVGQYFDAFVGAYDALHSPYTYTFGLMDLAEANQLKDISDKIKSGQELSDGERNILAAAAKGNSTEEIMSGDDGPSTSMLYGWGEIFGESVPFMVEMYLSGGSTFAAKLGAASAKGAAKIAVRQAIKDAAKQGINLSVRTAARQALANPSLMQKAIKYTGTALGEFAVGAYIGNTTGAAGTWADVRRRELGSVIEQPDGSYAFGHYDEDGKFVAGGESFGAALFKGQMASAIENYTELLGGHIAGVGNKLMAKGANKIGLSKLGNMFSRQADMELGKLADKTLKDQLFGKIAFNGYVGESLEEEAGIVLNSLITGDNKFSDLWDARTQADIWGGMLFSVGAMEGGGWALNKADRTIGYHKARKGLTDAESIARMRLTEETWKPLQERIDNTTNEEIQDVVVDIINDDTLHDVEKKAATDYIAALIKFRGYNQGSMIAAQESQEYDSAGQPIASEQTRVQRTLEASYNSGYEGIVKPNIVRRQVLYAMGVQDMSEAIDQYNKWLDGKTPQERLAQMREDGASPDMMDEAMRRVTAMSAYQGMQQAIEDEVDSQDKVRRDLASRTTHTDGSKRMVTLKDGSNVYIVAGGVVRRDDGTIDKDKSSEVITVYDPESRNTWQVKPREVASVDNYMTPEEIEADLQAKNAQTRQSLLDEAEGKIKLERGTIVNVGIDNEGKYEQVVIMDTDGVNATIVNAEGQVMRLPVKQLQDLSDAVADKEFQATIAPPAAAETQSNTEIPQGKAPIDPGAIAVHDEVIVRLDDGTERHAMVSDVYDDGSIEVAYRRTKRDRGIVVITPDEIGNRIISHMPQQAPAPTAAGANAEEANNTSPSASAPATVNEEANQAPSKREYNLNDKLTIRLEDGREIQASVADEADVDGNIGIYSEEPIRGRAKYALFTREELDGMVVDRKQAEAPAAPSAEANSEQPLSPAEEQPNNMDNLSDADGTALQAGDIITDGTRTGRVTGNMATPTLHEIEWSDGSRTGMNNRMLASGGYRKGEAESTPAESVTVEQEPTPLQRVPKDANGEPMFEATDHETAWDALVEYSEGDAGTAKVIADTMVEEKKKALDKAQKLKIKGKTPAEMLASKKDNAAELDKAQKEFEQWQRISNVEQRRKDAERSAREAEARKAAAERAAAEAEERAAREEAERIEREALNGVPEWHHDTPENDKDNGRNGSADVAVDHQASEAGQSRSREDAASGEQTEGREEPAERGGRAASDSRGAVAEQPAINEGEQPTVDNSGAFAALPNAALQSIVQNNERELSKLPADSSKREALQRIVDTAKAELAERENKGSHKQKNSIGKKKTDSQRESAAPSGERYDAVSDNTSSRRLDPARQERLSHNSTTLPNPNISANLRKTFDTIKSKVKKFVNSGYSLKGNPQTTKSVVSKLANSLGLSKSKSSLSYYGEMQLPEELGGRRVKIRLSAHPGSGVSMSRGEFDDRVSVVVYDNGEHKVDGTENWKEYIYNPTDMSYDDIVREIADAVGRVTQGEEFDNGTLSVIPQEYNSDVPAVVELAEAMGRKVVFDGRFIDDQHAGYVDDDGVIHINPNMNVDAQMSAVIGHELTHTAEGTQAYSKLVEFLKNNETFKKWLEDQGYDSLEECAKAEAKYRLEKKEAIEHQAKQENRELTEEEKAELESLELTESEAEKEIVADFCGEMVLSDRKFTQEMLSNVKETRGIIERIINAIRDFIDRLTNRGEQSESQTTQDLRTISSMLTDALRESREKEVRAEAKPRNNVYTYWNQHTTDKKGNKKSGRELLADTMRDNGKSKKEINRVLRQMDNLAKLAETLGEGYPQFQFWNETEPVVGDDGVIHLSCVVRNAEYPMNIDFSIICKKKEAATELLDYLVKEGDPSIVKDGKIQLNRDNLRTINNIVKQHAFEMACDLCFVEAKRFGMSTWANSFIDFWNPLVKVAMVAKLKAEGKLPADYNADDFSMGEFNFRGSNEAETALDETEEVSVEILEAMRQAMTEYIAGHPEEMRTEVEPMYDLVKDENGNLVADETRIFTRRHPVDEDGKQIKGEWEKIYLRAKADGSGFEETGEVVEMPSKPALKEYTKVKGKGTLYADKPIVSKMVDLIADPIQGGRARKMLNAADLVSHSGMDGIINKFFDLYKIINIHGGVSKPKSQHGHSPYVSAALTGASGVSFSKEKAFHIGGVRNQSFSDYEAMLWFDYMQLYADMGALGMPMQVYTKEPAYARLFGMMGSKINLSLLCQSHIPTINLARALYGKKSKSPLQTKVWNYLHDHAGLRPVKGTALEAFSAIKKMEKAIAEMKPKGAMTEEMKALEALLDRISESDNLDEWDYKWGDQTFPAREAFDIISNPNYSANVGTILVAVSDKMMEKALSDPLIKMVIPYHKSGLPADVALSSGVFLYKDYSKWQTDKKIDKQGKAKEPKINFYDCIKVVEARLNGATVEGVKAFDSKSKNAWHNPEAYSQRVQEVLDMIMPEGHGYTIDDVPMLAGKLFALNAVVNDGIMPRFADYVFEHGESGISIDKKASQPHLAGVVTDENGIPKFSEQAETYFKKVEDFNMIATETDENGDVHYKYHPQRAVEFALPERVKVRGEGWTTSALPPINEDTKINVVRDGKLIEMSITDLIDENGEMSLNDFIAAHTSRWENTHGKLRTSLADMASDAYRMKALENEIMNEHPDWAYVKLRERNELTAALSRWSSQSGLNFGDTVSIAKAKKAIELAIKNGVSLDNFSSADEAIAKLTQEEELKKRKKRNSILGRRGATNLDASEEATTRMDNLGVARQMETEGKEPLAIKQASGWERGADGMWRYEIGDESIIKGIRECYERIAQRNLEERRKKGLGPNSVIFSQSTEPHTIGELVGEDNVLFVAYPSLSKIKFGWKTDRWLQEPNGEFNHKLWKIKITLPRSMDITDDKAIECIIHELQHAIQVEEGFTVGGNLLSGENALIKQIRDARWSMFQRKKVGDDEGLAKAERELERLKLILDDTRGKNSYYERYHRIGGEVEARNVSKRMNFTEDERRQKLLEDTEDVAREDQIFLTDNLGESATENNGEFNSENSDIRYRTSEELFEEYPTWLSGQTTSTGQHTTQITSTKATYAKIGEHLQKEGRDPGEIEILDASSGLGVGTQALRDMGFKVEDVEPYPSENREAPTYSRYEDIDKKYDVVISNAVLNVIPDDWRADVLKSMADKLKVGGRLFINVRDAAGVKAQKQKIELDDASEILVTDKQGNIRAYQKGFTRQELADYVREQLGDGFEVEYATSKNSGITNGTAVVVTRTSSDGLSYRNMDEAPHQEHEAKAKEQAAIDLGETLGVKVRIADPAKLEGRQRTAKGWFDPKTGEVVIVLSNNANVADVRATVFHEIVGHKGLRAVVGTKRFNDFVDKVYYGATEDVRAAINALAQKNGWDIREATEEYIAQMAEHGFHNREQRGFWRMVADFFNDMLSALKIKLGYRVNDNDLRYMLWRSYQMQKSKGAMGVAEDIDMQMKLGVGNFAPQGEIRYSDMFTPRELLDLAHESAEQAIQDIGIKRETDLKKLQAGRDAVARYIRKALATENMPAVKKSELNQLLSAVKQVKNRSELEDHLRKVEGLVFDIDSRMERRAIDKLIGTKILDKDARGVNKAAAVDDGTRKVMETIRGQLRSVMTTDIDADLKALGSEIWHLEKDKRDGNAIDEDYLTDLKEERDRLKQVRDQMRIDNAQQASIDFKSEMAALQAKLNDPNQTFTEEDAGALGAYMVLDKLNDARLLESTGIVDSNGNMSESLKSVADKREQIEKDLKDLREQKRNATDQADKDAIQAQIDAKKDDLVNLEIVENAIKEQQNDLYRKVHEMLGMIVASGREALKSQVKAEAERRRTIAHEAYKDIKRGKDWFKDDNGQPLAPEDMKQRKGIWNRTFHALFGAALDSFDYMSQSISTSMSGQGYIYKRFIEGDDGLVAAHSNHCAAMHKAMLMLNAECESIFGKGMTFAKVADKNRNVEQNTGIMVHDEHTDQDTEMPMSKGTAMYVYQLWNMRDGRMKLANMGFTEESINQAIAFMGTDLKDFADWMVDTYYPQLRERMNARHKEIYLVSMAEVENYVPIRIDSRDIKPESDLIEGGAGSFKKSLEKRNGSIVNRTVNTKRIDLSRTAFDVLAEHTDTNEEWIAFARVRQDLDYMLGSTAFTNTLNRNTAGRLNEFEDAARQAALLPLQSGSATESMLRMATAGVVSGAISFKLWTAFKQVLSYPAFFGYSQNPSYLKHLLHRTLTWSGNYKWAKENLPSFYKRIEEGLAASSDIVRELDGLSDSGWKRFLSGYSKYGMVPNKFVDAITCSIGARAIYEYEKKRAINQGADPAEAEKMALRKADIAYNETQQSNLGSMKSAVQTSQNFASKMVTTFQQSNIGFTRKTILALNDIIKGIKDRDRQVALRMEMFGETEEQAKKRINSRTRKAVVDLGLFGFGLKILWDAAPSVFAGVMSLLSQGNAGEPDDDDEDEDTSIIGKLGLYAGYLMQGTVGGNLLHDGVGLYDPMSILTNSEVKDLQKIWDEYGISPQVAAQVALTASDLIGIKPDTWANVAIGAQDLIDNGFDADIAMDVAFILNMPKSMRKELMQRRHGNYSPMEYAEAMSFAMKKSESSDFGHMFSGSVQIKAKDTKDYLKQYVNQRLTDETKDIWEDFAEAAKTIHKRKTHKSLRNTGVLGWEARDSREIFVTKVAEMDSHIQTLIDKELKRPDGYRNDVLDRLARLRVANKNLAPRIVAKENIRPEYREINTEYNHLNMNIKRDRKNLERQGFEF